MKCDLCDKTARPGVWMITSPDMETAGVRLCVEHLEILERFHVVGLDPVADDGSRVTR